MACQWSPQLIVSDVQNGQLSTKNSSERKITCSVEEQTNRHDVPLMRDGTYGRGRSSTFW